MYQCVMSFADALTRLFMKCALDVSSPQHTVLSPVEEMELSRHGSPFQSLHVVSVLSQARQERPGAPQLLPPEYTYIGGVLHVKLSCPEELCRVDGLAGLWMRGVPAE